MSLKASFATVLRAVRGQRNVSQRDFADTISRTYLSKLETGRSSVTLDKLEQLSERLGLSPLTLLALTISESTGQSSAELIEKLCLEIRGLAAKDGVRPLNSSTPPRLEAESPQPTTQMRHLTCKCRTAAVPAAQAELVFVD
ncbi:MULTISPECIES: helix-turn-helix domain-containing protein [Pseudomonas fluorescens group]